MTHGSNFINCAQNLATHFRHGYMDIQELTDSFRLFLSLLLRPMEQKKNCDFFVHMAVNPVGSTHSRLRRELRGEGDFFAISVNLISDVVHHCKSLCGLYFFLLIKPL